MATSGSAISKLASSSCSRGSPIKRRNSSSTNHGGSKRPSLSCSLKQCQCGALIHPQDQDFVEIKAGLPTTDLTHFHKDSAVDWSISGEATLHKECWQAVLRDTRRRKAKNISIKMSPAEKAVVKDAAKTVEKHDSNASLKMASSRIALLLKKAKHCVVFTGAGISTSAGIGDYRGKEGKWTEMDREAISKEANTPIDASQTIVERGESEDGVPYEGLRPTYTHEALVKLMELGIVRYIISQNGDGLHGLSGVPAQSLAELHGNVFLEICEKCGYRYYRPHYVMDDEASQYYEELEDDGHTELSKPRHALKCQQCGLNHRTGRKCEVKGCKGFLKDSIINFGDDLEESILSTAEEQAKEADLILSLGTTMQVTPACNLVLMGREPLRLVIVNRQSTGFDEVCCRVGGDGGGELGVRVFGDCDHVMREVMKLSLTEQQREEWEKDRDSRIKKYNLLRTVS